MSWGLRCLLSVKERQWVHQQPEVSVGTVVKDEQGTLGPTLLAEEEAEIASLQHSHFPLHYLMFYS